MSPLMPSDADITICSILPSELFQYKYITIHIGRYIYIWYIRVAPTLTRCALLGTLHVEIW